MLVFVGLISKIGVSLHLEMIQRSHKIRMYPTKEQESHLWNTVGAVRFAYNWGLEVWEKWYSDYKDGLVTDKPSPYGLSSRWTKERPEWASSTARCSQCRSFTNLGMAWTAFWKGNADRPRFKKRGVSRDSFYVDNTHGALEGRRFRAPKAGWISLAEDLRLKGKISGYHVSTYGGKWWVSVQVEVEAAQRASSTSIVGVDVGLQTPGMASDGLSIALPTARIGKLDKRLKAAQRSLSRKEFRSKNYTKALLRKQKVQQKLNDLRADITHKFTTAVAKSHGTVVVETLSIESMIEKAPSRSVRRAYGDSLMREIHRQLEYKATGLIRADRYFPSSKLCSCCGRKKEALPPSVRVYRCDSCGLVLDRDLNAAINLRNFGAGQALSACGGALIASVKQEVLL
jgi:putative transposase